MALISVVVGLALTHVLSAFGAAIHRLRGHGPPIRLELVYLLWMLWTVIVLASFWWWEFKLQQTEVTWTLSTYFFLIIYSISFFLIAVILVPDRMEGVNDSFEYLISVRHWFFGMLAANQLMDLYDTSLKGLDWVMRPSYLIQASVYFTVCIVGLLSKNRPVHLALAVITLAVQIIYILIEMNALGSW
ncbi:MAG: hypothetical protein EOP84_20360 [Verrucomicrobiaceae bacterium]|nr:MAG: hypothetical protein EOP84_20360 [Verrucomicrobiaceae bacterium]